MISTCGIYSIKRYNAYNVPFVALDGEQALDIVCQAFKDVPTIELDIELWRIGTLSFIDGVVDTDQVRLANTAELLAKIDTYKEVSDDVSKTF